MLSAVHAEPICHPNRAPPHPLGLTLSPSRVGRTRGEVSIAQTLADSGYATGMWGKWQVGSDPEQRSPVDFGFDEAEWSPRTADEVMWAMQSYFLEEDVTSAQYAGNKQIPMELQPIH